MTITEKILAICAHHQLGWTLPAVGTVIQRTYAGHHQKSAGAWSWILASKSDVNQAQPEIGSSWPASQLARLKPEEIEIFTNQFGYHELVPTKAGYYILFPGRKPHV